ncbi:MAG TPA: putative porin [Rhizomicrobium sp.]
MTSARRKAAFKTFLLATAFAASAVPAVAQTPSAPMDDRILQILVAKKVITKAEAQKIQAEAAATPAPAPMPTVMPAPTPVAAPAPVPVQGGVNGDVQTIPYIPETVKNQLKAELRQEMTTKAEAEGWAKPGLVPGWLGKVRIFGDIRVRDEQDSYDKNNDPSIVNWSALNTSATPYNINRAVAGSPNPSYLNTTEDRNRTRIRARLGVEYQPDSWIDFTIRAGTGNDSSPVSPNQTLGAGGGQFSKYSLWLDQADLKLTPIEGLRIDLGRTENPFWTSPLLFYPDLNFDGFWGRYRHGVLDSLDAYVTAGAFPLFNTDLNFGSNDIGAFPSHDKWLFAGQLGAEWHPNENFKFNGAVGYFDFDGVQGETSSPCLFSQAVCDTDITRPQFQQFGNTMFPIRNIIADPNAASGLSPEPQYFGLASAFRVLDIHASTDFDYFANFPVRIEGDYINNLAFHKDQVSARQVNLATGVYNPGGAGWMGNFIVGKPDVAKLGDWNFQVGYRYLQTDATVDGLADADFHLGGTNVKGYVLMGYYGIGHGTNIGVRYFSTDVVTGAPYSNDVVQVELNTKF